MFDRTLNSDILDGLHDKHKLVLFHYWLINEERFKEMLEKYWPPKLSIIHGIFRRSAYIQDYKDDLPYKGKWTRLEDRTYQPGPKLKGSNKNCEFTEVLTDAALNLYRGGGGNHQPKICLIKFERNGKNGKYRANIFCDNEPLKPEDSLGTTIKLAA